METVLIVGSGPSGLVSAKTAKEFGFKTMIIEKKSSLGGLWSKDKGYTWNSMKTNLSKYTCMFSDFPWKENTSEFPNQNEVCEYLGSYASKFNIDKDLHFNHELIQLSKKEKTWKAKIKHNLKQKTFELDFKFVIVSSGFFGKPNLLDLSQDNFFHSQLHSADYKSPERFRNKRVAIIGGSFSGHEIAAEISKYSKKVDHYTSRPVHILPRYHHSNKLSKKIPIDILLYGRRNAEDNRKFSLKEKYDTTNNFLLSAFGNPGVINENLKIPVNTGLPPFVVISDDYLEQVSLGSINTLRYSRENLRRLLRQKSYDFIINCTGYKPDLGYISNSLLKSLHFKKRDIFQPLIIAHGVMHPTIKNIAFVGMYRGPYFGIMELQARLAFMQFSSLLVLGSDELDQGMLEELKIREMNPRPQFPHGDYIGLADNLASLIGVLPDSMDDLISKPVIPSHYRLNGIHSNRNLAETIIKEVERKYPSTEREYYV